MNGHYCLVSEQIRSVVIRDIRKAPDGHYVTIKPPSRSLDQNALLHALLQSLDGREFAGSPRDLHQWKLLMVSGHAIATGRPAEMVEGLEGEMLNIREPTSRMSVERMTSLIEYIQAWIAANE